MGFPALPTLIDFAGFRTLNVQFFRNPSDIRPFFCRGMGIATDFEPAGKSLASALFSRLQSILPHLPCPLGGSRSFLAESDRVGEITLHDLKDSFTTPTL
jgi:hypothetical protein